MSELRETRDPPWVHRSALQSVASWIWVVGFAFAVHAGVTFWEETRRAERDVRIVRDSGVQRILVDGQVHSQAETFRYLRRRRWWAALPYGALAALMGLCAWRALRRPVAASVAALGTAVLGSAVVLARQPRFDTTLLVAHIVLVLLLGLGVRSAVAFPRRVGPGRARWGAAGRAPPAGLDARQRPS